MIGLLVHDYALGRNGIVVGDEWVEDLAHKGGLKINWEWLVLYDDGELSGADTSDLKVIE